MTPPSGRVGGTRGFVVYQGPSLLTGDPVVVVVTLASLNTKTGPMAQAWVLRSDVDPQAAIATGRDDAICGDCVHRSGERTGRSCYVVTWFGPLNVYKAFRASQYPVVTPDVCAEALFGKQLRITAYGDPSAVPSSVWFSLLGDVTNWTGYTQQWRHCDQALKSVLMASVSTAEERATALAMGWRTYRARRFDDPLDRDEVICPASKEANHRSTCAECGLCRGAANPAKSVAIIVHGQRAGNLQRQDVSA